MNWIIINRQAAVRHICTSWIPRERIKGHHCAHTVCNGNSRNCSSEMFNRGMLEWMLCSILGGPLFHRPNPNCFLKVVNNDKFPTSNTLRKIHSFSRKMKSWWSVQVVIFNIHGSMGDNLMRASLHDVPLNLKPVTSITHCIISDISSKSQNHPTWILTAANTPANKTWYLADHGVVGAVLLPEEYSSIHTWGSFYFLHWKNSYQSCHWDDPWS